MSNNNNNQNKKNNSGIEIDPTAPVSYGDLQGILQNTLTDMSNVFSTAIGDLEQRLTNNVTILLSNELAKRDQVLTKLVEVHNAGAQQRAASRVGEIAQSITPLIDLGHQLGLLPNPAQEQQLGTMDKMTILLRTAMERELNKHLIKQVTANWKKGNLTKDEVESVMYDQVARIEDHQLPASLPVSEHEPL